MSSLTPEAEAENLFKRLDVLLASCVDNEYFDDPKRFRSLLEVVKVLGHRVDNENGGDMLSTLKTQNDEYSRLLEQLDVVSGAIEEVVRFEHGLSNTVDTMGDVIRAYASSREDIRTLRGSLLETQSVLTAKKSGQTPLKELWMKKVELEETLRLLNDLEVLKDAPGNIFRLIKEKKFFSAVLLLNTAVQNMFNEAFVQVDGLTEVRESLMTMKESLLETIVHELKESVLGFNSSSRDNDDEEEDESATRSDSGRSLWNSTMLYGGQDMTGGSGHSVSGGTDTKSVISRATSGDMNSRMEALEEVNWSMDLGDVSAELEESLAAPETMGSIYTRLLVRSIGCLMCEDDVERMLTDALKNKFNLIVARIHEWISMLPQVRPQRHGNRRASVAAAASASLDAKIFIKYVKALLNAGLLMLRRLMYVLRLLAGSKASRSYASKPGKFHVKEQTLQSVLAIWNNIEECITAEMSKHFVERDVENMTDKINDDHNSGTNEYGEYGDDDDSGSVSGGPTGVICPSTVKLSSPIYKDILTFNDQAVEVFLDEVDYDIEVAGGTNILKSVQQCINEELMPVIQGSVNKVMQELQMNSQHFSLPSSLISRGHAPANDALREEATTDQSDHNMQGFTSSSSSIPDMNNAAHIIPISHAAQICAKTSKPLFIYWLQLPQHRESVGTIIDRMIRSYASSAREELDAFTWRWISSERDYKDAVASGIRGDPLFITYRQQAYDGRSSVEEFAGHYVRSSFTTEGGVGKRSSVSNRDVASAAAAAAASVADTGPKSPTPSNALELQCWGAFWDVGCTTAAYPVSSDKVARDFADITCIAAITQGCDWLIAQLCRGCLSTNRRTSTTQASSSKGQSLKSTQRMEESIWGGVLQSVKELSKLAEEGLSLLRSEIQVACFHHLYQLSHLRLGAGLSQEPEIIVLALNQHLFAFQDAVLAGLGSAALAVILSPLCSVVPRLLLLCLQHIGTASNASFAGSFGGDHSRGQYGDDRYTPHSNALTRTSSGHSQIQHDKTHLLRAVVACQQTMSMLLESSHLGASANRRLQDIVTEEFERVRRYVTLTDMPLTELKSYITANFNEFTYEEYKSLFVQTRDKSLDVNFDSLWKNIVSRRNIAMGLPQR